MRILIVYQYFGTPNGSWSTRFYEFGTRWVKNGNKVTVISSPYEKSDLFKLSNKSHFYIDGIEVYIIDQPDANRTSIFKRFFSGILFALGAIRRLHHISYDVVIVSSGPITIGLVSIYNFIIKKKKKIVEVRDLWPDGAIQLNLIKNQLLIYLAKKFEFLFYKYSNVIVCLSVDMRAKVISNMKNSQEYITKTMVIENSCDQLLFKNIDHNYQFPNWLAKDDKLFLYTGSIGLMDAVEEIILGIQEIRNIRNLKIAIIGEGKFKKEIIEMVYEKSLTDFVFVLDLLPKIEIVNWLARSTATFTLFKDRPILWSSSPNKFFDSLAAGIPVIHNTKGWIKDLTDNKGIGKFVEPNCPKDMADAILFFFNQSINDYNEMKKNVLTISEQFSRDLLSDKYLEIMNNC